MCDENQTSNNHSYKDKERFVKPFRPDPGRVEKINLNFYFHTSLKCENKNLIFILIHLSEMHGSGRVKEKRKGKRFLYFYDYAIIQAS